METYEFNESKVMFAICFHLIDDGHCDIIDPDGIREAFITVQQWKKPFKVRKGFWVEMTNADRLQFLLLRAGLKCVFHEMYFENRPVRIAVLKGRF